MTAVRVVQDGTIRTGRKDGPRCELVMLMVGQTRCKLVAYNVERRRWLVER